MSLIELVVSIAVFGVVIVSIPSLFTQIEQNNLHALEQEAILSAQSSLSLILTNEWDEYSYNGAISAVLDVKNGDSELDRAKDSIRRVGHIKANKRRKFFPNIVNSSSIAYDNNIGDIDDFDGVITKVQTPNGDGKNRLFDFELKSKVFYVEDVATYRNKVLYDFYFSTTKTSKRTNIKMVQVRALGDEVDVVLGAYACNIGEGEILWREF